MCGTSLRKVGQDVFELFIGNVDTFDPDELDLVIPKSIGFLC